VSAVSAGQVLLFFFFCLFDTCSTHDSASIEQKEVTGSLGTGRTIFINDFFFVLPSCPLKKSEEYKLNLNCAWKELSSK